MVSTWGTTLTWAADVRYLSVTIVAAITSTIAIKDMAFVVYNCEPDKNNKNYYFYVKLSLSGIEILTMLNDTKMAFSRYMHISLTTLITSLRVSYVCCLLGVWRIVLSLNVAFSAGWSWGCGVGLTMTSILP
jgi:uncharacterized membrane protein YbjE (DUF340 family)